MVESSMVTERLKSFMGLWIPRMLQVAMVLVGGAGGADGVGDGGPTMEGDKLSGGGLGGLPGRVCKVGLVH